MRLPLWRKGLVIVAGILMAYPWPTVAAVVSIVAPPPAVLISELQTGSSSSASEEFVELYNASDADVALAGWSVEYKAATTADATASWSKRAALTATIKSHGFYLVAPKTYLPAVDAEWSSTLAASGGVVRVKDLSGNVVDLLGYGSSANIFETAAAAAPPAGQSLERLPGKTDESAGNGVDTGNNALDFLIRLQPAPQSSAASVEPDSSTTPNSSAPPAEGSGSATDLPLLAPPLITELLANPASPQSDEQDEYVELYNPNSSALDIGGYKLQTGSNFHDSYIFPPTTQLAGNSYTAFFSAQTKLSLVNGGGAARLLDGHGSLVDQTGIYPAAPEGQAWALADTGWSWTIDATPGRANVFVLATTAVSTAKSTTKASGKAAPKVTTKAKAASKPKSTSKVGASAAKTSSNKADNTPIGSASWLIIVVVALTIGYAIYEYRHDIERIYRQLRGHQGAGPKTSPIDGGE